MLPLVEELSRGFSDAALWIFGFHNAIRFERVAAQLGFVRDDAKVPGDTRDGVSGRAKALELRVARVTTSASEKHRLREESFAPQRNESDTVEMTRMNGPETHEAVKRSNACTHPVFFVADMNRPARSCVERLGFEKEWPEGDS
jgi:hypothetical protein